MDPELVALAEEMGWHVVYRDLGRRSGEVRSGGVIVINPRKGYLTQRMTLAHELGHVALGHDWGTRHDAAADERAADIWAAGVLIKPDDYRMAEEIVGSHPGALAKELGVTAGLVVYWQQHHQRRGTFLRVVRPAS
ncbi:ImmA/IrrE family metallo-endopeptidase [Litorihabitans aurantiacus]|uniref:IrrE N-terminal-like domain-containing protein n=1 Tax=Litorihabitans aurantiacus TaxID=1930061 RepID=A0AA38CXL5_9MICO|nr:ImmA/IrrE family metallo-endopeptidase [Litorihabitans aurantiacus]GMA33537.1 hypothetical protein GCM10025875_35290 [Litorihabitans aurantiacus]GMA33611.1 hypothetical protein GCM10025875_36030 [Litorihabitans aurantiacus]